MSRQQLTLKFFWLSFAAFLAASIPHVAYFFRAYEPSATDYSDILYWVVSYAIAISIDVTIFLLSVTVANLQKKGKSKGLTASVYFFILFLTGLSWYINFTYAVHFASRSMLAGTQAPVIPLVGDINPLIASCFQVLVIAYTWISDKIAGEEVKVSSEDLEKQVNELARIHVAKSKIAAIKRASREAGLKAVISTASNVASHGIQAAKSTINTTLVNPVTLHSEALTNEQVYHEPSLPVVTPSPEEAPTEQTTDSLEAIQPAPLVKKYQRIKTV